MMKRKAIMALTVFTCCLVVMSAVLAQASANYKLKRQVLADAGGAMTCSHYAMDSVLGQPSAIGGLQSANFQLRAGYWYGVAAPSAPAYNIILPIIMKNYAP